MRRNNSLSGKLSLKRILAFVLAITIVLSSARISSSKSDVQADDMQLSSINVVPGAAVLQSGTSYDYKFPNLVVTAPNGSTAAGAIRTVMVSFTESMASGDYIRVNQSDSNFSGFTYVANAANPNAVVLIYAENKTTAQWNAMLRSALTIHIQSSSSIARKIRFNATAELEKKSAVYSSATGHYYEWVAKSGITWQNAMKELHPDINVNDFSNIGYGSRSGRTFFGQPGYLATVTSQEEHDFLYGIVNRYAWLGGTCESTYTRKALFDKEAAANGGSVSSSRLSTIKSMNTNPSGTWTYYWIDGPEKGMTFTTPKSTGTKHTTADINYSNWCNNEPNNAGNEFYLHFYTDGQWNDYANGTTVSGYMVEYDAPASVTEDTTTVDIALDYTGNTIMTSVDNYYNDASAVDPIATVNGGKIDGVTFTYQKKNSAGNWVTLSGKPTEAGEYRVQATRISDGKKSINWANFTVLNKITYYYNYNGEDTSGNTHTRSEVFGTAKSITAGSSQPVFTSAVGTPTRLNYDFLGWSTNPGATTPQYKEADAPTITVNADTKLYAVWQIKQYNLMVRDYYHDYDTYNGVWVARDKTYNTNAYVKVIDRIDGEHGYDGTTATKNRNADGTATADTPGYDADKSKTYPNNNASESWVTRPFTNATMYGWSLVDHGSTVDVPFDSDLIMDERFMTAHTSSGSTTYVGVLRLFPVWETDPRLYKRVSNITAANDSNRRQNRVGDIVRFEIKARNYVFGSAWRNITVTDELPEGLTPVLNDDGTLRYEVLVNDQAVDASQYTVTYTPGEHSTALPNSIRPGGSLTLSIKNGLANIEETIEPAPIEEITDDSQIEESSEPEESEEPSEELSEPVEPEESESSEEQTPVDESSEAEISEPTEESAPVESDDHEASDEDSGTQVIPPTVETGADPGSGEGEGGGDGSSDSSDPSEGSGEGSGSEYNIADKRGGTITFEAGTLEGGDDITLVIYAQINSAVVEQAQINHENEDWTDALQNDEAIKTLITNKATAVGKDTVGDEDKTASSNAVIPFLITGDGSGNGDGGGTEGNPDPGSGWPVSPLDPDPEFEKTSKKISGGDQIQVDDVIEYTLHARVARPGSLWTNVTFIDRLPEGLSLVPGSVKMWKNGIDTNLTDDEAYNAATHTIKYYAGHMKGGEDWMLTFQAYVNSSVMNDPEPADGEATPIDNVGMVEGGTPHSGTGVLTDDDGPRDWGDPGWDGKFYWGDPDGYITKESEFEGPVVQVEDRITYTITVENRARKPSLWRDVYITDPVPMGMNVDTDSFLLLRPGAVDYEKMPASIFDASAGRFNFLVGDVSNGEKYIFTYDIVVLPEIMEIEDVDISNKATATGSTDTGRPWTSGWTGPVYPGGKWTSGGGDGSGGTGGGGTGGGGTGTGGTGGGGTGGGTGTGGSGWTSTGGGGWTSVGWADPEPWITKQAKNNTRDEGVSHIGDQITYTVTVGNDKQYSAWTNVTIIDALPEGIELVMGSMALTYNDEIEEHPIDDSCYDASSRTIKVPAGDMMGADSVTLIFDAIITKEAVSYDIGNSAYATGLKPGGVDVQVEIPEKVYPLPGDKDTPPDEDLPELEKAILSPTGGYVDMDDVLEYEVRLENKSKATWKNLFITDHLPFELELDLDSVTLQYPDGHIEHVGRNVYSYEDHVISVQIPVLKGYEVYILRYKVQVEYEEPPVEITPIVNDVVLEGVDSGHPTSAQATILFRASHTTPPTSDKTRVEMPAALIIASTVGLGFTYRVRRKKKHEAE